jgi:hypothetical protein
MAVMWPRVLPSWVLQDPRRSAECRVYERLAEELDDSWSVYYSRPWWGISPTGGEIDGEADFVVAHSEQGVLFLEVKGGLVRFEPKTSIWTSTDRLKVTHKIKDPIQQAVKSKHELLKKFQERPSWPRHRVRLRHGVILPDSEPRDGNLIGGFEQELFCFATEFRDRCGLWVNRRLASHAEVRHDNESGPGVSGVSAIDQVIAAPARLAVPLHRELEADVAQQDLLLTGAQMQAVVFIEGYPRVVVEGGAGTGKTIIACELAMRYSRAGRRTLLICLSEALAASLKQHVGVRPGLEVKTLAELRATAGSGSAPFDAVIVDEGQDVDWADWDMVERCISSDGLLRVLFDSNQAIYRARADLETRLQARGIALALNLRNTQRVAAVTEMLYRGPLIQCAGSEGRPAVLLEGTPEQSRERIVSTVTELIRGSSALLPADIAVLVPDESTATDIRSRLLTSRVKATNAVRRAPESVVVETISRFKGLEAVTVVVLADRISANSGELSYVGVSRARALLVVAGPVTGTQLGRALIAGQCEIVQ